MVSQTLFLVWVNSVFKFSGWFINKGNTWYACVAWVKIWNQPKNASNFTKNKIKGAWECLLVTQTNQTDKYWCLTLMSLLFSIWWNM